MSSSASSVKFAGRSKESSRVLAAVLAAGLGMLALSGCGPSSSKSGKAAATTNAAATKLVAKTNQPPRAKASVNPQAPPPAAKVAQKQPVKAAPKAAPRTNAAPATARAVTGTNAVAAAPAKTKFADTLRNLQTNPAFYPVLGVLFVCLCLTVILISRLVKGKGAKSGQGTGGELVPKLASKGTKRKAAKANVHSCNILQIKPQSRQIWQFDSRGKGFVLNREQVSVPGETLPARLVAKDWHSLFQRKLNVAWLPSERVFLRAAQFPASNFEETVAMVELQLEKLSPLPVAQIVWSIHVLPHTEDNLQSVIVMIVARNEVEEFLGQLEGQGYLADRLELPLLDQLQATTVTENGAWIYPDAPESGRSAALVAWWYGGMLQNVGLITLPSAKRPESLKEQLLQMAWAGELEGWLSAPPTWHLVAEATAVAEWEPALRAGLEQPVEVIPPVAPEGLAALTAARAARAGPEANLLPAEYSTRYHQQFVDRLWMRGLGAVFMLYLFGVLLYFARLQWEEYLTGSVETKVAEQGPIYTNAMLLKAKFQVLKDRQDLKFAALDCWKAVAERLPDGVTLDGYNFNDGKKLTLSGSVAADQTKSLLDFDSEIRKATKDGELIFDRNQGERITWEVRGPVATWHCILELKKSEGL